MKKIISMFLAVCMLTGCGSMSAVSHAMQEQTETANTPAVQEQQNTGTAAAFTAIARPTLLNAETLNVNTEITGTPQEYTLEEDFSNVINRDMIMNLTEAERQHLLDNYFYVAKYGNDEFFEIYESNRYDMRPSFVTVDSILHTYHLYYAYMQKKIEADGLLVRLQNMSDALYTESSRQLSVLKGTEWEEAAQRNTDFFGIAMRLFNANAALSPAGEAELALVEAAEEMAPSPLFKGEKEYNQDYTQFRPRGYYTESDALTTYFKVMMWYGQMNFTAREETLDRSALLAALAIRDAAADDWNAIYSVTAFFAGESDDNGYCEYLPLIESIYGEGITADKLAGDTKSFESYHAATAVLPAPKINSMVVYEESIEPDRDTATRGFRILGQRFTLDAYIMQRLVYRDLPKNDSGEKRTLPDALDVPAALGSDRALEILQETTDVEKWKYTETVQQLRSGIKAAGDGVFSSSISAAWLDTMRPVLEPKDNSYPVFMRNQAWMDKSLNTFLGNYTELKHDTVLYAKQVMMELGGAGIDPRDDRGYVEPEPVVYAKLQALTNAMITGLQDFGMISDEDISALNDLASVCKQLETIALKELRGELPTDEEFEFIRTYGGQLEHLWMITVQKDDDGIDYYKAADFPAALVTDIATDPESGECLQIATGHCDSIYVAVPVDGTVRIARGSVYSFYQFRNPVSERMTDDEWRSRIAYTSSASKPEKPEWQESFRDETERIRRDENGNAYIGTAMVRAENLNIREEPDENAAKAGKTEQYEYYNVYETTENGGYTWYRIGERMWIADKDGEWVYYMEN